MFVVLTLSIPFRCGPCRQIAPAYAELSTQYPNVVFLKVNVDTVEVRQLLIPGLLLLLFSSM